MQPHERLNVWRKSHALTLAVWRALEHKKARAHASVASHLRTTTLAITLGIAEGAVRPEMGEFVVLLERALRRARECQYLIRLATELEALTPTERATLEARADQVCRMIESLKRHMLKRAWPKRSALQVAKRSEGAQSQRNAGSRPVRQRVNRAARDG